MKTLAAAFLLLTVISFPQVLVNENFYSEGRIILTDSQKVKAESISILKEKIVYYQKGDLQRSTRKLEDVMQIDEYQGNSSATFSILGAAIGTLIGYGIALNMDPIVEKEQTGYLEITKERINPLPIIIGGLSGTLLGLYIGSKMEKWETVYRKSTVTSEASRDPLQILYNNSTRVSVILNF